MKAPIRSSLVGTWELDSARSTLRQPVTGRVVVTIQSNETRWTQEVVSTDAAGNERRQVFRFEVGAETSNEIGGAVARVRAGWVGSELLVETTLPRGEKELHFRDYWSVSPDGLTLTMAHRDDDVAGQVSVLVRRDAKD